MVSVTLSAQTAYVPERVFDTSRREFTDFEMMLAAASTADVVFVGEEHDDPNSHRLELAILEGLARRRTDAVVAGFEMFERDVQAPLDRFQSGRGDEQEFLKASRPWSNYATDYKPLVDFALKKAWPVFASNVPRAIAGDVAKGGLDALKKRAGDDTKWFAADLKCPVDDDYFHRFAEAMGEHPDQDKKNGAEGGKGELQRYYQSQCLKDETMGESIARAYDEAASGGKHPLVVHFNGAFHSDFAEGTASRTKRRLPGKKLMVLTLVPVANLDTVKPDKTERKRADYLIYTIKNKK